MTDDEKRDKKLRRLERQWAATNQDWPREQPIWIVWELDNVKRTVVMRAVDTTLARAERHKLYLDMEALQLRRELVVRYVVEESRANHLYGGADPIALIASDMKKEHS